MVPSTTLEPVATRVAGVARVRRPVQIDSRPVEALRALAPLGACLLESRTQHPGARYSYIPFNPVRELALHIDAVEDRDLLRRSTRTAPRPWEFLDEAFRTTTVDKPSDPPFQGGWVGYLAHEAAHWILGTPIPEASPPTRPAHPLGLFRLYADVLVVDHAAGTTTFIGNELGHPMSANERLEEAAERVTRPAPVARAARAVEPVSASLDDATFQARVRDLQGLVRNGDCFQVNLTTSYAYAWERAPQRDELITLYDEYAGSNPGAWAGFFEGDGLTILSSSPECLADLHGGRLRLRPIAGTRARGATPQDDERFADELRADPKERAEHAMLVDLARNDAAAVCTPGTVTVPNFAGVERYRHVMHLVSEVEGDARPGLTVRRLLESVFPGGTVTGAPKRRAVQRIAEVEGAPRGPYTGTLGYVSLTGSTQWNLLIRTLIATPTHVVAHAGCGIVEGSRPSAESAELAAKAHAQVQAALGRALPAPPELRCGQVEPGPSWTVPTRSARVHARVLLIDHEDSFVHNLADYCSRLGATAIVHSALASVESAWDARPTHLILSPGPGRPEDFPNTREHLARAQRAGIPVLGVCLGHQGIAQLEGAAIERHPQTVHGKPSRITRTDGAADDPLLQGWAGDQAARYHSLVVARPPSTLVPLAQLDDGTLMAYRHATRPRWGLQFHPESILTDDGLSILAGFLRVMPHE